MKRSKICPPENHGHGHEVKQVDILCKKHTRLVRVATGRPETLHTLSVKWRHLAGGGSH